jgi:hypothetical protein
MTVSKVYSVKKHRRKISAKVFYYITDKIRVDGINIVRDTIREKLFQGLWL